MTSHAMLARTPYGQALLDLFAHHLMFKVLNWSSSSSDQDTDRVEAQIETADVVASREVLTDRHMVAIDIDHPTWLVRSTTPDHYHLYIDVPGGIEHEAYIDLLDALAAARVIESGYTRASSTRGHSDVRLPWVKKESA